MTISAVAPSSVSATPASRASEEAYENAGARAQEAAQQTPVKGAPAPGTGQMVDVSA